MSDAVGVKSQLPSGIRTRTGRVDPSSGKPILYMDVQVHGIRIARSLDTTDVAKAVKEKDKIVERARAAFKAGREDLFWQSLGGKLHAVPKVVASKIREVTDLYRAAAMRIGPQPKTVANNISALWTVIEKGSDMRWNREDAEARVDVLTVDLKRRFADVVQAASDDVGRGKRSIISTLGQADSVFSRAMLQEYSSLTIPDLSAYLRYAPVKLLDDEKKRAVSFTPEQIAIMQSGRELRDTRPDLYAVWFLGFYCALRAGEIEQARTDWIQKRPVDEMMRQTAPWLKHRDFFWVLNLDAGKVKNTASRGMLPLADDVAAELLRIAGDREYILPVVDRNALSHDAFSAWMISKGFPPGKGEKKSHALRAYRQRVWRGVRGFDVSEAWVRHRLGGVSKHYLDELVVSAEPLGLDQ